MATAVSGAVAGAFWSVVELAVDFVSRDIGLVFVCAPGYGPAMEAFTRSVLMLLLLPRVAVEDQETL